MVICWEQSASDVYTADATATLCKTMETARLALLFTEKWL